jgi:adapter protein MecA 1/2
MIEAIPVNMDSVILIITKVEDPEELDTRFSKFAPFKEKEPAEALQSDGADNIIDIFQKLVESKMKSSQKKEEKSAEDEAPAPAEEESVPSVNLIRLYVFRRLDDVIAAARALNGFFDGSNSLYKTAPDGIYPLVVHQSDISPEDFNKVCNILSEYSQGRTLAPSGEAYLKEHAQLITANALQTLAQL